MKFKNGDKVRLKEKPTQTGVFIRYSRTEDYEGIVVWDETHTTEFVPQWEIERCEDGKERNPLDLDKCPLRYETCEGYCPYYTEE